MNTLKTLKPGDYVALATLRTEVRKRKKELIEVYQATYPQKSKAAETLSNIGFHYDLKGHNAGQAIFASNQIRINSYLLEKYRMDYIAQTVTHEIAHIAAYVHFGRKLGLGHGKGWQHMMLLFGVYPNRTHDYETKPARNLNRIMYHCICREHPVTVRKHNSIQQGQERQCTRCKSPLVFMGS